LPENALLTSPAKAPDVNSKQVKRKARK